VLRVDADVDAAAADFLDDAPQLRELRADGAALARGVLQDQPGVVRRRLQDALAVIDDLADARLVAGALVAAEVEDDALRADQ
jgi:hypothetical protein